MKNIFARLNHNVKMLKKYLGAGAGKICIDSMDFGRALDQYFSYYFPPPTLKYPLQGSAENIISLS